MARRTDETRHGNGWLRGESGEPRRTHSAASGRVGTAVGARRRCPLPRLRHDSHSLPTSDRALPTAPQLRQRNSTARLPIQRPRGPHVMSQPSRSLRTRRVTGPTCGSPDPTDRNCLVLELHELKAGPWVRGLVATPGAITVVARAELPRFGIISVRPGEVFSSPAASPNSKGRL